MNTVRDQRPFWATFVALGTLAGTGFIALRLTGALPALAAILYTGLSAVTAAAILAAAWRYRPPGRAGWLLLGAGQVIRTLGESLQLGQRLTGGDPRLPSVADAFYLAQYPFVIAALATFIRRRTPGRHAPALLDAGILAVAAGLVSWVYLIGPHTVDEGLTTLGRLVSVAYPAGDLLLLAIGLRLLRGGARSPSYLMLLGALFAALTADAAGALLGGWGSFLWPLTYALLGGAALHPSMRRIDEPAPAHGMPTTSARLVALAAASLLAPVVLLVQYHRGQTHDVPVIAIVCAVLFLLVLGRMALLVAEQRRIAVIDALTGLDTRRAFEERLRARRPGRPFAVILLDIDHFKRINDSCGHPAGDLVLREVARRLRETAGPGVTVARYGGEEFALLVPDADATATAALADRLRSAIGSAVVDLGAGVVRAVTVSAGTAVLPADTTAPDELVLLADRALYAAKRAGRDLVVAAGTPAATRRPAGAEQWPTPLPRPRRSELEAA
ncbi:diguanylate cyclase [Dactylosporangium sp. CA-233914]|uniref:GGDEF domain-containing protein n=1 Tax=Dactylosporangium sp. CA-233914 TaxID=3239934 RepID=UPI003D9110B1